jgi:hypothetical protein
MKLSRAFICTLIGFTMTLFAWFGPWEWPAAPAFFILKTFFVTDYAGYPFMKRALVLLLLIAVNSGVWALVAFGVMSGLRAVTRKRAKE